MRRTDMRAFLGVPVRDREEPTIYWGKSRVEAAFMDGELIPGSPARASST